jgi:chitinase
MRLRTLVGLAICALIGFVTPSLAAAKPEVIAYVFERGSLIQPGQIDATKLTRINYAFALIKHGKIINGEKNDEQNLATLVALKSQNPSLKVLISVGGWLGSGQFSDMALTKKSRQIFIDSAVKFLERNQLDGLDIDWEYPGLAGAGNRFRAEDKQNYTELCKELRERFDKQGKRLQRPLLLSVAAGATSDFLENTEMGKVQKYLDTVNVMAYDFYEAGVTAITGNHAPLFTDPTDPKKISADRSVREFEQAGVPAEKIVLGVPFYGHVWGDVNGTNNALFQPGKAVPNSFAHYNDIQSTMIGHGFVRYWDAAASAPYLYNADKKMFVSYEDPESLALKCKYVLDHKLSGIMFWEYNSDPTGALLNAVDEGLWNRSQANQTQ